MKYKFGHCSPPLSVKQLSKNRGVVDEWFDSFRAHQIKRSDMSKLDTKKVYKKSLEAYENYADMKPSKRQRKEKRKERQDGQKEIRRELKKLA
jgi:hypothetical protein